MCNKVLFGTLACAIAFAGGVYVGARYLSQMVPVQKKNAVEQQVQVQELTGQVQDKTVEMQNQGDLPQVQMMNNHMSNQKTMTEEKNASENGVVMSDENQDDEAVENQEEEEQNGAVQEDEEQEDEEPAEDTSVDDNEYNEAV